MTDDFDPERDLETRLRGHYQRLEPGAATPGWSSDVDAALRARRPAARPWRSVLAAAAVIAVAIGLVGGLRLLTLPSTAAVPSPSSPISSSSAGLDQKVSPAPSATPNASGTPIKPTPMPTATLTPAEVAATVDQAGSFPGGLWAVRGSEFLVSSDGGAHWATGTSPAHAGANARTPVIAMTDATHAWAVTAAPGASEIGAQTDVLHLVASRSVDGGRTWASTNLPGNWPEASISIAFPDATHGFILVLPTRMSPVNGAVFATEDGGRSWSIVARESGWARDGMNPWLGSEFAASDATTLWAGANPEAGPVTHPVLAVSRDAGRTWRDVQLPGLATAVGGTVYGGTQVTADVPIFTSPTEGWVTVSASDQNGNSIGLLYHSTDGGHTWTRSSLQQGQPSGGVAILDRSHWLVPIDNVPYAGLLETTDGATTWSALPGVGAPSTPWLVWIAPLDPTHVAATTPVGDSYPDRVVLLLSADAGRTWTPAVLPAR